MDETGSSRFDWQVFLPARWPHELATGGVADTGDLSALFIWLSVGVFALATGWLAYRAWQAWRLIAFLRGVLRRAKPEQLPAQRRELRALAGKHAAAAPLWRDFEATWVEAADGRFVYQTVDAAQVFNPHTLAKGITENRLLLAVPGILTGFGILGTFVGLQIGLSTLDLSSPQVLTQSIVPLIQGAAVAFSTSVWGITTSLLFNFLEKTVEQTLHRRIRALCVQADALLQAHLPEQTLLNIERAGVESENALKGLAEQIGSRMQEALLQVPGQIQAGIDAALAPAIEKLVAAAENLAHKQSSSAQEALAAMIEQFVGSVSASGENSRQGLENASQQLSASLAGWSAGMENFLGRLDQRAGEFDSHLGGLLEQGKNLHSEAQVSQQFLATVAGELQRGGELLKQATQDLHHVTREIQEAGKHLGQTQVEVARLADSAAQRQRESSELLAQVAQRLEQTSAALDTSGTSLQASAQSAHETFTQLAAQHAEFVESLRKALNNLRKQVGQMMNDYATDVQEQTKSRLEQWNSQTQEFAKSMVAAVQAMHEILGEIDSLLAQRRDK